MFLIILICLLIAFIIFAIQHKLVIRFDTFFRKGFKKYKDKYRGLHILSVNNGMGKTYSLIDMVTDLYLDKKIIYTNIKSFADNMKSHNVFYENDFNKIIDKFSKIEDASNYIIIFDEIFTLVEKGKLDKEKLSFLSQMRKRNLIFFTTCQEWLELNITFRRYCRYMVDCNMINIPFFNIAFCINEIYNAYEMKWSNEDNEYICPIIQTNIKKCSKKIADSYDTFEVIKIVDKSGNVKTSYSLNNNRVTPRIL